MLVQKSPDFQEKPFACTVKECDMTFTNKDHLEWHHKKHEMMLNLGLINKTNEVADQTPTPTRFIRNCEEVGLFQDLQNVNPFDELFKKATDLAKTGITMDIQTNNSDDTLHTPHILPHITENHLKMPNMNLKSDSDCESFDFPTNNDNSDSDSSVVVVDGEDKSIKEKIKENILNKKIPVITVIPFQDLTDTKNISIENQSKPEQRIKQIREMNRAAQIRCRRRKQQIWKEMEQQIVVLKQENKRLRLELEALRILHSKCKENPTNNGTLVASVISSESSQAKAPTNTTSPATVPLLIQILPNTQLSLIPTESTSQGESASTTSNNVNQAKKCTQKRLRKIVPRILMRKS